MYAIARTDRNSSGLLERLASRQSLHSAWRKVRANRGAAGVDAISIAQFEKNLEPNLTELTRNLLAKTYEPLPARYVSVPKSNGKLRELAIPTVRDRVAQRSMLDHVEPLFEPHFLDCSFGFRPDRSTEMAIQRIVLARARGLVWTVDADIKDCFPSIDHGLLMSDLRCTIDDQDALDLINLWLDAGALDGSRPAPRWVSRWRSRVAELRLVADDAVRGLLDEFLSSKLGSEAVFRGEEAEFDDERGLSRPVPSLGRTALRRILEDGVLLAVAQRAAFRGASAARLFGIGGAAVALGLAAGPVISKLRRASRSPTAGAPQGAPLSPLLSNIYLHPFDVAITGSGYRLVRYADDFVLLCGSEAEAAQALADVESTLSDRRLQVNQEKTRIVSPSEAFQFLGYRFEPDGRVEPPETLPDVVRRRVVEFARHQIAKRRKGL